MNPKKKPAFLRQEWYRMGNQRKKWLMWRKPRGNQSKLRMHIAGKGFMPNPGYGAPTETRGMHPCGMQEMMVNNTAQLAGLDASMQAVRIAGSVGDLKRLAIQKKAEELKLRVLNPKKIELRKKQKEEKKSEHKETKPVHKEEKK